ncbi:MAG: hypothetical protein FWG98_14830, partial [Candidatus Cloacimonetes bacterium]|nr:hypothetical protein [Candidatus Cloacimonadota bacterium]
LTPLLVPPKPKKKKNITAFPPPPPPPPRLTHCKISTYDTRFRKVLTKEKCHSGRMTLRIAIIHTAFYSIKFTKSFKLNSFSIISRLLRNYSEAMRNISEAMRNVSRAMRNISEAMRNISRAMRNISGATRNVSGVMRNISDYKINNKKHIGVEKYV